MSIIIDGKQCAADIRTELRTTIEERRQSGRTVPGLALLLVGNNPASEVYVGSKDKACKEIGMNSTIVRMPESASEEEILRMIDGWNHDDAVHGILVQLPLPKHINEMNVIMAISPDKDVDGFHPVNVGRLVIGLDGFAPCTPAGIVELLKRYSIETSGKHVVVVGRSNIVGKPMANLMYQKYTGMNAIVTVCHTGTDDISFYTRQADILIMAVGVPHLITPQDVKPGVVVIDVGMNRLEDTSKKSGYRLVGDVDFQSVATVASAITPVPGGVGPMTIAMLLSNTMKSLERKESNR
ncbi:MAG: bifunctional methylenetetrahydrofolate dehydrogenase/methenyltetrahydrofolate cyclohydrolase FolD [Candidatus Kapabacteria bacterium]|nr:bifunctional methylenetetrahydrofolate dehydrogenase/methenyltetrahydrofolate cyclohydrolase FolD [Candidatus Kapabacteria bacterium]